MSKKPLYNLSRRKLLAGLGTVGLASAGAGLGTSAYFNDTESFSGNTLRAGELDLKMDWQQSYYTGKDGEDPEDHRTWHRVNAYPDTNSDGVQDPIRTRLQISDAEYDTTDLDALTAEQRAAVEAQFRAQFANLPGDVEMPVISLDDVKPGDRGEITISMHLFDNPGYLWVGGELRENAENGVNEPEANHSGDMEDDPFGPESGDNMSGELADAIQAKLWYDDDCDNSHDTGPVCMQLVVDNTDSMGNPESDDGEPTAYKDQLLVDSFETFVHGLDADDDGVLDSTDVGLSVFESVAETRFTPTNVEDDVITGLGDILNQDLITGGSADLVAAIEGGASALAECPEDSHRVLVLVTNGVNITESELLTTASTHLRANGGEVDKYVVLGLESHGARSVLEAVERLSGDHEFIFVDDIDDKLDAAINGGAVSGPDPDSSLAAEVSAGTHQETVIAEGTLAEVLADAAIGGEDGYQLDFDRSTPEVDCFPNSTTRCVAFQWWLPASYGNELQTDSVTFDLSLYAEQCRHNDGSNAAPFA